MIPIYISRRCPNCQELLITIHKQKPLHGQFSIIDIDTTPYPNYLQVVPTMVVQDSLIVGDELFKYIQMTLDRLTQRVTPPLENNPKTVQSDTEPVKQDKPQEDDIMGFCMDGSCSLDFSSLEDNVYIDNRDIYENLDEGEIKTPVDNPREDMSEKHKEVSNNYDTMMKQRQLDIKPRSS